MSPATTSSSGAGGAIEKFEIKRVRVKVGQTVWVSTGAGTICKSADSLDDNIATGAPNDGILFGGFDVNGVNAGEVIIKYSYADGDKIKKGHCIVTVVP